MARTSAFVSTVNSDRIIVLPEGIPVGAKVAIVLLPTEDISEENAARALRFQKVMDAIRAAIHSNFIPPEISKSELDQLIIEARQASKA
jgi:hypothetical protein